jgi:hypothetical protein
VREDFEIEVYDNVAGAWVDATLVKKPDPEIVVRAEERWRGWIDGVEALNTARGLGLAFSYPSAHWKWGFKAQRAHKVLRVETYVVLVNDQVEGMMMLYTFGHPCRLPAQAGKTCLYVDLVATAPWNIKGVLSIPRYSQIGDSLLGRAVMVSHNMGLKGRIGLHSLPGAVPWYQKMGMVSLGPDSDPDKQDLEYFEFEEKAAETYLTSRR